MYKTTIIETLQIKNTLVLQRFKKLNGRNWNYEDKYYIYIVK